jgi:hypothetical protein
MLSRCVRYTLVITLNLALSSVALWAAKDFVPPHPENANTYAAKDAHPAEKVTVAIELYDSPPKDDIFITSYGQNGILPVFLIVSNDGNQPITVNNMRVQLVTARRTKLESLDVDDVFRRIGHIGGSSNGPQRVGPIPLPGGNKNKKAQKQYQEILNARFAAEAVEPHTTKSGFLFFDIAGVREPVAGSHIYLTGLRDAGGADLMYFEIPTIASNAATGQ